jgi:hypothetical protein
MLSVPETLWWAGAFLQISSMSIVSSIKLWSTVKLSLSSSLSSWLYGRLVIKWPLALGRFAEFPPASPSGMTQTCLGLRGHLITNLPQDKLLLIIIVKQQCTFLCYFTLPDTKLFFYSDQHKRLIALGNLLFVKLWKHMKLTLNFTRPHAITYTNLKNLNKIPSMYTNKVFKYCGFRLSVKPAAHERTCRAYLLFVTSWIDKMSSCGATFTAFSSFVTCKPNIKHVWYFSSFMTKKFSCAASKRQARLNRKICSCAQLAELKKRHELVILISHVVFNSASLSIQLVTNNKYARQVRSCAAGLNDVTIMWTLKQKTLVLSSGKLLYLLLWENVCKQTFLKCGGQTNKVDYLCPENLYPKTIWLLTIGNIISNGCDPETGVFPGKFVEVDVPLWCANW